MPSNSDSTGYAHGWKRGRQVLATEGPGGLAPAKSATKGAAGAFKVHVAADVFNGITTRHPAMLDTGEVGSSTGWRFIIVAAIANLAFKGVAVAALGDRKVLGFVAFGFGASFLAGAALLIFRS
jgi:hypothetical protein